ncbi:MAG: RNA-binding domain-containing protein [Candidatus Woesearchaeota archaeon]
MKVAHSVEVSVFCKDYESAEQVKDGLRKLFPFRLEDAGLKMAESEAEGLLGNKILIFSVHLTNPKHVRLFLDNLLNLLGKEGVRTLLAQAESRLDEELFFFIRISKPEWLSEGRAVLTDSGNCYHMRILIAAYPKERSAGLKTIKEYLGRRETF